MINKYISFTSIIILLASISSCDDYGKHGPDFKGTIQFLQTDTSLISQSGGFFAVAFFNNSANSLYYEKPITISKLNLVKAGDKYTASFTVSLGIDVYYVAAVWLRDPYNLMETKPVLGTFGCDTNIGCTNFAGADGSKTIDFYAFGDTAKHLFYNVPK